jgi:hypothetical protein
VRRGRLQFSEGLLARSFQTLPRRRASLIHGAPVYEDTPTEHNTPLVKPAIIAAAAFAVRASVLLHGNEHDAPFIRAPVHTSATFHSRTALRQETTVGTDSPLQRVEVSTGCNPTNSH